MKRSLMWLVVVVVFMSTIAEGRVISGDELRVADMECVRPVLGKRLVMCEPTAGMLMGTPGEPPTYTARYVKGVIIREPILFDSSNHGYGWYLSANEPVDYAGGYLMAVYRKYSIATTGEIGVAIWETADSLHSMMICGQLNANPPTGPGGRGRYPSAIATWGYPYALWTEFWDPAGTDPQYADGLMSVDELGWMQGFWTPPMDFAENSDPGIIYGLWVVMADFIPKYGEAARMWHIITCWERELNSDHYTFIHGTSDDGIIWTFENATLDITPAIVPAMNHPQLAYGEDGFTIWMATGRLPEFDDFRILMGKSYDYGETWVDTIYHYTSFDMGIPNVIGDTLWFVSDGDTVAGVIDSIYTGFTYDQDVTIAPDGSIHFVDTHVYFVKASSVSPYWYWYIPYTGIYDFHSEDNGVTWTASKVADLNGFEPDDEEGEIETTNMVDIAADDHGNLYVAWTDRPDTGLVESPHSSNQFDDYYFRNIYCAVSTDGGYTWGEPIEVTNTPDVPEYSLHLCRQADSDKGGTIYIGFTVPDLTRPFESPDMLADYVQWLYIVEINGLTVGVNEARRVDRFVVTPCIASDKVVINYVVGDEPNARLAIYDITGRELKQIELKDRAGRYELDVSTLPQGTYFVKLTTGSSVREAKFVVIK